LIDRSNTHFASTNLTTVASIDEEVKSFENELYNKRCVLLTYKSKSQAKFPYYFITQMALLVPQIRHQYGHPMNRHPLETLKLIYKTMTQIFMWGNYTVLM
jgi:type VI protein secretion system component Hcp